MVQGPTVVSIPADPSDPSPPSVPEEASDSASASGAGSTEPPSGESSCSRNQNTGSNATSSRRCRNWGYTSWQDTSLPTELPPGVRYICAQQEIAPTTGELHVQGFMQLETPKSLSAMKKKYGRTLNFQEHRYGSYQAMRDYCMKERTRAPGTEPVEFGDFKKPGQRSDLREFVEEVKSGKRKLDLLESHTSIIARYPKFYKDIRELYPPKRDFKGNCLIIGPTGCGKTTFARTNFENDMYVMPCGKSLWFDGYEGQEIVLMDDFSGQYPLSALLQLLDRWTQRVEIKGSHTWFNPMGILVTTNIHPQSWYDFRGREEQRNALYRRFSKVMEYTGRNEYVEHDTNFETVGEGGANVSAIPYFEYEAPVETNARFIK